MPFRNTQNIQVGGVYTGNNTVDIYDADHVRVTIKNHPDYVNRWDHSHAYIPPAYKQPEPSHTSVKIDVHYNGHNRDPHCAEPLPSPPREQRHYYDERLAAQPGRADPAAATLPFREPSSRNSYDERWAAQTGVVTQQDDAIGRTAMELNKVRDLTQLDFKPDANGIFKANVQGVFKNGFSKVFKEDLAFAQKLLGSDAVTLSDDRQSIVLKRPMTEDEIGVFRANAAAIGMLKRGDLRRAHEAYDVEIPYKPQSSQSQNGVLSGGDYSQSTASQSGQGTGAASAAAGRDEAVAAAAAASAVKDAERANLARKQAEAAAAVLRNPAANSQNTASSATPQDKIAIAQIILAKLGYDLGPQGNDGLMGHHDPKGGFTGSAIEAFKAKDVGLAPPLNTALTDKTFDRLIQRYQGLEQGKDGISPTGVLDKSTVDHLRADQNALKAKGVKVSHTIPETVAVQTEVSQNRTGHTTDPATLQARVEQISKQLGMPTAGDKPVDSDHIIPLSQTPVFKTALYVPTR